jgi:signal transduction histidine kinase
MSAVQTPGENKLLRILIVDDDSGDRKHIRRALERGGFPNDCVEVSSIEAAISACAICEFDCAIVDYQLPGFDGLQGITALNRRLPLMPIIMATGQGNEMVATEAMKRGASDYILKAQVNPESIRRSVDRTVEKAVLMRKVALQREELENFAKVLVHDLSAPISSLQMFAPLIEEELGRETPNKSEIADYCRQVASASQRTGALIDALFQYTRADSQIVFEPVDMELVLKYTLSNLARQIEEREVQVTHGKLPTVRGSAPQLMQLLQNLIGNGIKYCESVPPTISVTAVPSGDNGWLFAVGDNGIGIAQRHYERIFEPFRRLHGTQRYQGSGLGLATCKKIVERHGGVIRCESKLGEGSMFFFTLQGTLP